MSWANNLLEASFRGVAFDCLSTDDEADRALSTHDYPYINGADIEDLGENARLISIEATFFGDDYEQRLQNFMRAFRQPGPGELIHPVFGSIKLAQPAGWKIHHEADNVDSATVSLRFMEQSPGDNLFNHQLSSQKAAAVSTTIQTAREKATSVMTGEVGKVAALPNAAIRIDQLRTSMTSALSQLKSQAQNVVTSGLDAVKFPTSWASDISSVIDGVVDLKPFSVIGAATQVQSVFDAISKPAVFPKTYINTLTDDWRGLFDGMSTPIALPSLPGQPAHDIAVINAHVALEQAMGKADAARIVLESESQLPTLSPPELETMVNASRNSIETVITQYRGLYPVDTSRPVVEALKDTAMNLQESARAVIEARPPLITKTVNAPTNLRLLAHKLYGDHARGAEILRLNPKLLRNPNSLKIGDVVNVYAG